MSGFNVRQRLINQGLIPQRSRIVGGQDEELDALRKAQNARDLEIGTRSEIEDLRSAQGEFKASGVDSVDTETGTGSTSSGPGLASGLQAASLVSQTAGGGNVATSTFQGAAVGASVGGPIGASVGAGLGLFSGIQKGKFAREKAEAAAKAKALGNISLLEQERGQKQQAGLKNIQAALRDAFLG